MGIIQILYYLSAFSDFRIFIVILEDSYNLFIYKRFKRKVKIEVTNWQPCLFLRFAVSCCQCLSSWCKSNSKLSKEQV